jgi:cytosine/adenosine deaminase-related metal-dependent hydrolase
LAVAAPGCAADLVLFHPARVATRPAGWSRSSGGERRLCSGQSIEHVFVNGTPVVEQPADDLSGPRAPQRV